MKLAHHEVVIALKEPFLSNTGATTRVRQSIVTLTWEGMVGLGTARGAAPADLDACAPVLAGASPFALRAVLDRLAHVGPAALSAVDMALHDLLGKACGQPLYRVLGLDGLPAEPTARSIGACPDAELVRRAEELAHWPILKLKLTPEDTGRRVGVLRSVYDGRIRVDGNGSWPPDRALRVAEEIHRHGVEIFEQPVAPGSPDDLRHVHERSPVPVFADEDCQGPEDVLRLSGRVAGINIKLGQCGGLARARDMIALARGCGLRVMLGSKVESVLGTTAMAQLAGLVDHLDLDGPLLLRDDPFTGVRVDHGWLALPTTPGIGVAPRETPYREDRHAAALRSAR
ncbi:enolase C-terminal domain-like protein [Streptomyces sp. NPDC048383]|uniref:mandelate racemase/muconate lactonizing enzyme family protein n=1 Tax=Streptomyces sp. NPDC048383 TaxID=3155386 RepID=UPI00341E9375